ncbi:MAG TPA: class I mannose-6-phosphate isomerase [Steroidobacteraceae bacterium]|nr:class I mannose-6-phosphate isomerase [Steroidobacteraceae bacterium]
MAVELARIHIVPKPWGNTDLRPWHGYHDSSAAIGEIWFERTATAAPSSVLLLKLIFTSEPLSIQVHPADVLARAIGLAHGKCEAWYVLSATADAKIAVGLTHRLTPAQLRLSILDGSIAERVQWRPVRAGDSTFVPSGTIHAIGAGLVIAEIQQRSDATFRLFDYGRNRELHVDVGIAAANADQRERRVPPRKLTATRTVLVGGPRFVLERLALPDGCLRDFDAAGETWLFTLAGGGRVGSIELTAGTAVFLEADRARIEAGPEGLEGLVAYVGCNPAPDLLRCPNGTRMSDPACGSQRAHVRPQARPVNTTTAARVAP